MIQATHFIVKGVVQGVGFRYFVENIASRLDVDGYVRNMYDGSVEVVVAGSDNDLQIIENALKKGPSYSRVDSVTKEVISIDLKQKGFNVVFQEDY